MSVATLEVPNSYNLYANSLTTKTPINQPNFYRIDYNIAGQTIPNGVDTAVQFPSNITASNFSAPTISNTIYNVPMAGAYLITYGITYPSFEGQGIFNAWISTSTTPASAGAVSMPTFEAASLTAGPPVSGITLGTDVAQLSGSAIVYLIPSNNVSIMTYQNTGASRTTSTSDATNFAITFLHT
jgi:hypothetical protein